MHILPTPDRKFTGLTKESHFTTFASCLWCLDIICSIFYFFFFWDTKITSNGRVCHLLRERCLTEVTVQTVQSLGNGPYSWRYSFYWHIFLWEQITTRVWRSCSIIMQVSGVLSLLADLSPLFPPCCSSGWRKFPWAEPLPPTTPYWRQWTDGESSQWVGGVLRDRR